MKNRDKTNVRQINKAHKSGYIIDNNISKQSFLFHFNHMDSAQVVSSNLPVWQPLIWLSSPVFATRPGDATCFLVSLDTLIFILCLVGLPRLFKREPFYFIWLMIGKGFLLLWKTKWPQYVMILLAPFCLSAAHGMVVVVQGLVMFFNFVFGFSDRRLALQNRIFYR